VHKLIELLADEQNQRETMAGHGTRVPAALAAYRALDEISEAVKPLFAAIDMLEESYGHHSAMDGSCDDLNEAISNLLKITSGAES
jgi:hypothetical protein